MCDFWVVTEKIPEMGTTCYLKHLYTKNTLSRKEGFTPDLDEN